MHTRHILLMLLFATCTAGCGIPPTVIPSATHTPTYIVSTKAPEPSRPLIGGEFSGVLEDTLVYFHVYTPDGWEAHWGTRPSNGSWQAVVTEASGIDYTVTADAEGFICTPASYSIRLVGLSAYLVEGGALTDTEALQLDFHCEPVGTPTPASDG